MTIDDKIPILSCYSPVFMMYFGNFGEFAVLTSHPPKNE